ncbi:glycoside hydrolase family 127 protein [Ohessyouella blattaphilus]|uniref:Glycoside hydrolase family 127 protein n=1 Tax=Ohessyouella blattaphilus TaxID=2949333 RepID=A0ABT1EHY5_9FIRM|nr:beta-L-arabinofuranosidase domain-containing protein [Ohessyouella blattaphilus]MCP1110293.1 glycoside hydrolase family 127 protein [Ohessyouella blattaphilus]MCR8563687.1 glycoside hydrolase family 127 protein [Ohessyouella blattaphilus]
MEKYRLIDKTECTINDSFWNRYTALVRESVIPYQWEILNDRIPDSEPSHSIRNFKIAAGTLTGEFYGEVFQDSDVYKWLEAVGNVLLLERNQDLEAKADEVICIIEEAQEADGYLNTYYSIMEPDKKWTNVLECHELYCAGHFIEGAISYFRATGKDRVLKIAFRLANHIETVFGPEEGKLHGYPGHQEIEIALLRLYEVTGTKRYLDLAKYFIDTRGTNDFFEQEFEKRDRICFWNKAKEQYPNRRYNQFSYKNYNQFHLPVRQQKEATGHAVRAVYMYTAMADLAAKTEDKELFAACKELWENIVSKQLYITGGIGSTPSGEAFTLGYDLPNDTNYSETCASIGLMFFAQKMLLSEANRTYADVIEQALYNTVLGGMNDQGNRFFYVNPLAVVPENCKASTERNHVKPVRQKWFACACCPPNIARTLPSLWQYAYTADKDTVYSHLFMGSEAEIKLGEGSLEIKQETNYPWSGKIKYQVKSKGRDRATLAIRIPSWAPAYTVKVAGQEVSAEVADNGYVYLSEDFANGLEIEVELKMTARILKSNKNVHYNLGRVAVTRGPIVYCLEEADNGKYLDLIEFDPSEPIEEVPSKHWSGVTELKAAGVREAAAEESELYQDYQGQKETTEIQMVPYFLWNNRTPGEMLTWMRVK